MLNESKKTGKELAEKMKGRYESWTNRWMEMAADRRREVEKRGELERWIGSGKVERYGEKVLIAIQNEISVGKKPFEFPLLKDRGTLSGITIEMVQKRVRAIKNEMKKRREALRRQS